MKKDIVVNARFLTRSLSGVDRVAIALLTALADRDDIGRLRLVHPRAEKLHLDWLHDLPNPALRDRIELVPFGRLKGHAWEQLELPFAVGADLLLSLCSTGPIVCRNQAVMIHDAQVWDAPQSYSPAFRLAYKVLLPVLARRARFLLTVSAQSRRRLEAVGVAPAGKAQVVPNGADHILGIAPDPAALDRFGLSRGGYFLAIGSLAPHKNLKMLLEAAAARGPGAPELIVAGGLNAKIFADAGLEAGPGTRLIGRVSDAELRALYEGAMALVFPSLTEGFGLPPVEAMLCGCPVVATTGGAVPEVCGDAVLSVDPQDRGGWTAAMERIAVDPDLREDMATKGRARAARFTWAASAATLATLLRA
ncbi:glycosyltransferase involved in cell wall biosynthesis [Rhodobacter aestuarii]|uniref:Glycosyltransferase involved in cell wall bisynthesis n=1 Tax=Rhodobacter aestuarii TaxID=453582 RepID=A0A1N7M9N5_9RHOB|nr:glycosyltransferase family 1 protein [Rhodobacter aestuarii]PTV94941.1 glycosyltransferase involved in cell wall biosynthesis [Rhodobacter aestuarii]SIS82804.1 Glycosyltransferase involved in cell wall bisynthesis [Rhodobacter aestuarii]